MLLPLPIVSVALPPTRSPGRLKVSAAVVAVAVLTKVRLPPILRPPGALTAVPPAAAVEMAKDWRTERRFGKLEALLAVADAETSLIISGTGDVIEPEDGIIAIGSGGSYALSAARALMAHTELDARTIASEAINIAGDICIYTNRNVVVEEL